MEKIPLAMASEPLITVENIMLLEMSVDPAPQGPLSEGDMECCQKT